MKTKLMALMVLTGAAMLAETRVAIGVNIGGFRPARPVVVAHSYRPACPGPGYIWIDGYYDPYGAWYDGYWDVAPYAGAYWVAPRVVSGRFVAGFWDGPRHERFVEPRRGPVVRGYERGFVRGYERGYDRANDRDRRPDRGRDANRGRDDNRGFRPGNRR